MLTSIPCSPGPCNHPSWSPDGSSIAYAGMSDDSGDGIGDNSDIYVMDLGTGDSQRLTTVNLTNQPISEGQAACGPVP